MCFLELRNVSKQFGAATVVADFSLAARRGELIALLGPSGCGKTTTLRMIAGLETPSAGSIAISGADLTGTPPHKRNIGMVFQSYALFPNLTVADNIGFGLKVAGRPRSAIRARVAELLGLIHLEEHAGRYPHQLSGGQQQRVALARALAISPQVLLLDEPLSALDARIRRVLRQEIRAIQRQLNITTVYVTHDQEEALALADRIVVMNQGRIEQIGPPAAIYNFPQTAFVASFVGTLNLLGATVIDPADGWLEAEGQRFRAAQPLEHSAGERVDVALRPESLALQPGPESANRLQCTLEDIQFLGSIVRLLVRMGAASLHVDLFNTPQLDLPERGARLTLGFAAESCLILGAPAPQPVESKS